MFWHLSAVVFSGTGGQEAWKLELAPTVLTEGFAPLEDQHYPDSPTLLVILAENSNHALTRVILFQGFSDVYQLDNAFILTTSAVFLSHFKSPPHLNISS